MFSESQISLGKESLINLGDSLVGLDRFIYLGTVCCLHSLLFGISVFSLQIPLGKL